ncbi:uncharacterized protein LOC114734849 [Neltuma alba]|uniref:uncharacterized protein LOC114734849 n=1 Tax=Neltuma alba TaxID=207710 RepID=UPI0010A2C986|nr:uncharacterized protein LOC114734849 [Prosopis alba]
MGLQDSNYKILMMGYIHTISFVVQVTAKAMASECGHSNGSTSHNGSEEDGRRRTDEDDGRRTDEEDGSSSSSIKWIAPVGNWLKINTDCAFSDELGIAAMCFIIRDSNGWLLDLWNFRCSADQSPLLIELKAMESAMSYAINNELDEVIFESDDKTLIDCILQQNVPSDSSGCDALLESINFLRTLIKTHRFVWVPKEANLVANWIANTSLKQDFCLVNWILRPPTVLQDLVMKDLRDSRC